MIYEMQHLMSLCMFGIAASSTWAIVIAFALVFGLGSGILDAGLNMYIATYHSARQMNWLHACFGIGITFGPLIMTFVLQQRSGWQGYYGVHTTRLIMPFVLQQPLGWQVGYAIVGAALITVILMFAVTRHLWRREGLQTAENKPVRRGSFGNTLRVPVIWFSMATFFVYVGLEIGIGQWIYTLMTEARHLSPEIAGPWVSRYWGAFTGGRIFFGVIANRFAIDRVLRLCMLGVIIGAVLFWWNPVPVVGFLGLVILGFAQAPVFPMLMADTAQRVGAEHAENGISMQMGAVGIGTAVLPGLIGTIGKNLGLEMMTVFFVVAAIVVFILHEFTRLRRVESPALSSIGD